MGMFDYIVCEKGVSLPIPDEMKDFDLEFQTKSLDKALAVYIIADDGHLYLSHYFEEDQPIEKKKVDYHGTIKFGDYHQTDLIDYCVDFEAKFTDGLLQDIKLLSFKKIEHESLVEKNKKWKDRLQKEKNKFSNKLFRFVKNIITKLGFKNFNFQFCYPEIVVLYKPDDREKQYGLFFDKISTGVCFARSKYSSRFDFRFLGFGFIFQKFEPLDF
jgi:hypothetical protein